MKIRIVVLISTFLMVLLFGCVKIYTSPPEAEATVVPEHDQSVQEANQQESEQPNSELSGDEETTAQGPEQEPESQVHLPDLVPTEILFDKSTLKVGATVYFDSGISNNGLADADGFNIKWFVNGNEMGYGGHQGIRAGSQDMTNNSQFNWKPTQAGTFEIKFVVDCDRFIEETNENNNASSVMVTVASSKSTADQGDWPDIDDLVLQNGIYYYTENNFYREPAGNIAGFVKPFVYVNGVKTGGVCLKPTVCSVLQVREWDKIPDGQVKLKVIVPIDISNFSGNVEIREVPLSPAGGGTPHQVLSITCDGTVPILNSTLAELLTAWNLKLSNGTTLRSVAYVKAYRDFNPYLACNNIVVSSTGTEFKEFVEGVETEYIDMYFGALIARKQDNSVLYLDFVTTELPCVLIADDLLTVDGKIVFMNEF